ncbi:MAG: hypothetical protein JTT11_04000, partial [Candidatus Brockarchaeota archaeon]|nr:hypothetical protein [Candidatus Brockarchaeota archaeon]
EGLISGFLPFIWLGDEDLGLSWFSESDKNWFNAQTDRVTEIAREGGKVALRLHLVSSPIEMAPGGKKTDGIQMFSPERGPLGDLSYAFGLQATPVKPVVKDAWDYRICHAGNYGIEASPAGALSTLIYQAEGNIDIDRGTLEFWIKPLFDPLQAKADQTLFVIQLSNGNQVRCCWQDRKLWLLMRRKSKTFLKLSAQPIWRRDEFHHFVLTWGERIRIYSDGKLIAKKTHHGLLHGDPTGGSIAFGGPGSYFIIDEIRISDVVRTDEEISFAAAGNAPALDEHTLLLDHLDESFEPGVIQHLDGSIPKGMPATRPAKVAGAGGIIPTHPPGVAMFTAGKFSNGLQLGLDRPVLDYLAGLGVRTICFHEHWTEIEGYTSTTRSAELRNLVKACHERGIQLLLYFGFMISDIAPEWPRYRDEVLTSKDDAGSDLEIAPQPRQKYYSVCYRSVWQDFLAHGIARLMDEFGVDGVYLDGTGNPQRCVNIQHGCGYVRPDGSVAPSYSIWATREMMRRIYTIVKSRKPDGQVNVHNSTCMTVPTLAWATGTWDGEQFPGYGLGDGMFATEVLPLDVFRTEFMGHQWGVPAEFLCYERPFTYNEACAITLLHNVLVRGNGPGPNLELESKLWRICDEFGMKEADWLPYWRNSEYVNISPKDAFASLYRHPKNGVLAIISNLGQNATTVRMRLNLDGLTLPSDLVSRDALTGGAVPFENSKIDLDLSPLGYKIIWIQPRMKRIPP